MEMNEEIRKIIMDNGDASEITGAARRNGMRSLSDDGWRLVGKGITTPEEVMRVTKDQTIGNGLLHGQGEASSEAQH